MRDFVSYGSGTDGAIKVFYGEAMADTSNCACYHHDTMDVYSAEDGGWIYSLAAEKHGVYLKTSADFRNIEIHFAKRHPFIYQKIAATHLLRSALFSRFIERGLVSLHGAAIEIDSSSVIFTGHSGVGKSTRADVWVKQLGAKWISGDRPSVGLFDTPTAYGAPWDGKEQIFRNVSLPIKAILDVRRSDETYIQRLTSGQVRQVLLEQCFIPMWDTDTAAKILISINIASASLPVYRVFCGPDEEAAREVFDILWKHPERIREAEEE